MREYYVPGLGEKDPDKIIRSLMQAHENSASDADDIATNTADIATNAANIATNTADIATNSGDISALQGQTSGYESAWTTFSPTVTPQSGTFTSASASGAYKVIGKLVHFSVTITITTVGTATGAMSIALPVGTAARIAAVPAIETVTTGRIGYGRILSGGTTIVSILQYDNASWIGAGATVTLTGIYEQT